MRWVVFCGHAMGGVLGHAMGDVFGRAVSFEVQLQGPEL